MIEQAIKKSFDKYLDTPLAVWVNFVNQCERIEFKKNEIIKHSHHPEKYAYFILSGSCGVFLWKDNSFVCLDITLENDFFSDYFSLVNGNPSPLETVALENTTALRISKSKIDMIKKDKMGSRLFFIRMVDFFLSKQQLQIDLLTKTAEQRYIEMLDKQPQLIKRIPQKHIASYLGIRTESFSRIKKKLIQPSFVNLS